MNTTPKPYPFKWSFSQWETYNQCPAKWKFGSVLKLPRLPAGPAASRGTEIHATVERYIKGECDAVHEAVKPKYMPILDEYRNANAETEKRMQFDADWAVAAPGLAACTGVLDAVKYGPCAHAEGMRVDIAEWKSGKPKDSHEDQRWLYALFGIVGWTNVSWVTVTTYYLEDTALPQSLMVPGTAHTGIERMWQERTDLMQRDELCAPRPGLHCKWCDFAKAKGGPCAFGG